MPSAPAAEARVPFWVWAALPVGLAVWLRVRGIGDAGPFVDEAGNILVSLDSRLRVLLDPLGQGRPALAWQYLPCGWFPFHPLETARLMSAVAGLATMAALAWALHQLAGRAAAFAGLCLWAVMPLAVWHERLALQDPFVTAWLAGAAALMVAGSRAEGPRAWGWPVAAGTFFGVACLFKISAVFALGWLGLLYLALPRPAGRPLFNRQLLFIALGALVPLLALGGSLRHLGDQSAHFESLPAFSADNYWAAAGHRLTVWAGWYAGYGGWPLALLAGGALVLAVRARSVPALAAALGAILSVLVAALFYNRPYARYVLPDQVPLILFLALAWGTWPAQPGRWRALVAAGLLAALARWGCVSVQIGTDPRQAAVPADEIAQYFTGPWSGRGVPGLRRALTDYADQHNVRCLVLTHRFLRPGCYGLMLAELGDPRINVVPFTVYEPADLAAAAPGVKHAAAGQPVAFFLLYEGSLYPAHPWLDEPGSPARRVLTVPRGAGEAFTLYQFDP